MELTMKNLLVLLQLQEVAATLEEWSEVAILMTACEFFVSLFHI
jgi:hypothetical protein